MNRVIVYGCHDASQPGNQAWSIESQPDGTQHVVNGANGLCMCVLKPT